MSADIHMENVLVSQQAEEGAQKASRKKNCIIHFMGERPSCINMEHVALMYLEGKVIHFEFYTKTQAVGCADEDTAKGIFQLIMNQWGGE